MKESCVECRHHDVFWGGAGCNLLNNGERCKFESLQDPAEGRRMTEKGCLTYEDIEAYFGDEDYEACFWHISDLEVCDTPKELSEFSLKRPPQSWCYVEELEGDDHAQK